MKVKESIMDNTLELTIHNDLAELQHLNRAMNDFVESKSLPEHSAFTICLAIEEIISNIIKYAYDDRSVHDIMVRIKLCKDHLALTIEDDGCEFNPLKVPKPDIHKPIEERPIGGLGIHLVRSMCNNVTYKRAKDRNILNILINIK